MRQHLLWQPRSLICYPQFHVLTAIHSEEEKRLKVAEGSSAGGSGLFSATYYANLLRALEKRPGS